MKFQPKPGVIKMKITQCDIWHIFSLHWTKHFIFGHFIAIVAITVISLRFIRYYRSSNSKHCGSDWDFENDHFFEIILILVISKKSFQYHWSCNLNPVWSRWKLLNEIYDTYSVSIGQNTSYLDISSQLS